MADYHMSQEEKEYLSQYDITQFDRPSIATDIAVFSIMGKKNQTDKEMVQSVENYRKSPEKKIENIDDKKSHISLSRLLGIARRFLSEWGRRV